MEGRCWPRVLPGGCHRCSPSGPLPQIARDIPEAPALPTGSCFWRPTGCCRGRAALSRGAGVPSPPAAPPQVAWPRPFPGGAPGPSPSCRGRGTARGVPCRGGVPAGRQRAPPAPVLSALPPPSPGLGAAVAPRFVPAGRGGGSVSPWRRFPRAAPRGHRPLPRPPHPRARVRHRRRAAPGAARARPAEPSGGSVPPGGRWPVPQLLGRGRGDPRGGRARVSPPGAGGCRPRSPPPRGTGRGGAGELRGGGERRRRRGPEPGPRCPTRDVSPLTPRRLGVGRTGRGDGTGTPSRSH